MIKNNSIKWMLACLLMISMGFTAYGQAEKSLLWKISGNGLAEDSYLFGTII